MKYFAIILLFVSALLAAWFLIFGGYFGGYLFHPDASKAKEINPFITGLVVPMLTLGSTLLVLENLRTTTLQNFNNNFFNLINQHHRLVENLSTNVEGISTEDKPSIKRNVFDDLAWRIAADYKLSGKSKKEVEKLVTQTMLKPNPDLVLEEKEGIDRLVKIYGYYFHIHHSDLSHYFRNLYHIVKFVHESKFSRKIKKGNMKILRAQLSNYEMLLLAYNGLHPYGEKFFSLIEKYELIKNLNSEDGLTDSRTKRIVDINILLRAYKHLAKEYKKKNKDYPLSSESLKISPDTFGFLNKWI